MIEDVLDARQKTERMIQRYELMDQCYEKFCDHIANIFEQIHKYKKELALLREKLSPLESRYNTVSMSVATLFQFSTI